MIDFDPPVLLMGIFGRKIAVTYIVLGIVIAGGPMSEKLYMEEFICRETGCIYGQKGCTVCFNRYRYWCIYHFQRIPDFPSFSAICISIIILFWTLASE